MNNKILEKNKYLVKKVSIIDTLRNMPIGEPVRFEAKECGPMSSARSAASRLAQTGEGEWDVTSDDNGVTFIILRKS
ncbi:hypothetical protein EVA_11594 [gut metagenome]|uniref:SirA family protein n=1 Tax=gut metagenome TaxID=749906 RepID=J9CJP8_9ZZZZ